MYACDVLLNAQMSWASRCDPTHIYLGTGTILPLYAVSALYLHWTLQLPSSEWWYTL